MGWLSMMSMGGYCTPKAYLDAQFTWSRDGAVSRVLRSSVIGRTYYAAVERSGREGEDRKVFAAICLFRHTPKAKDGYVFAYKDMDETVGPNERTCPAAILDLLTPTDCEYAIQWRADCRANLAAVRELRRKRRPVDGDTVVLAEAMRFTDGAILQRFRATRLPRRRNLVFQSLENGRFYRIGLARRDYEIVSGKEGGRDGSASLSSQKAPAMSESPSNLPTLTEVAEIDRAAFLPNLFGPWYLRGEAAVYSFMSELCSDYSGGYWDFFEASNGARYLAPRRETPCHLMCGGNHFGGTLSPEATGIVVTLFALSHLSFSPGAPADLSLSFERLYEYASAHPEAELIFRAID